MSGHDVTVCVATYGDPCWRDLAQRAIASAEDQAPVIHVHGDTLHGARNKALGRVTTRFVVHLDADDELGPGYIETLAAGSCDLRAPAVQFVAGRRVHAPYVPKVAGHHHACDAGCVGSGAGNWLVIGTMARTELLRQVGGWRGWAVFEDYDLWQRAILAGGTVEAIPAAVYVAHVRPGSRNRAGDVADRNRVHAAINVANLGRVVIDEVTA